MLDLDPIHWSIGLSHSWLIENILEPIGRLGWVSIKYDRDPTQNIQVCVGIGSNDIYGLDKIFSLLFYNKKNIIISNLI